MTNQSELEKELRWLAYTPPDAKQAPLELFSVSDLVDYITANYTPKQPNNSNTLKTDGAVVSDELREQVSKVIDGWRYEQDLVASKAEDFPEHKGAGCGCPVCVKMSALNSQATNELIALITADRKRVALEARIQGIEEAHKQILGIVFAYTGGEGLENFCDVDDVSRVAMSWKVKRIAELKAKQEPTDDQPE